MQRPATSAGGDSACGLLALLTRVHHHACRRHSSIVQPALQSVARLEALANVTKGVVSQRLGAREAMSRHRVNGEPRALNLARVCLSHRYLASLYATSHRKMSKPSNTEFPNGGITNGAAWYPIYGSLQARWWWKL